MKVLELKQLIGIKYKIKKYLEYYDPSSEKTRKQTTKDIMKGFGFDPEVLCILYSRLKYYLRNDDWRSAAYLIILYKYSRDDNVMAYIFNSESAIYIKKDVKTNTLISQLERRNVISTVLNQ